MLMKRRNPLSTTIKWSIVVAAVLVHPLLLYLLLPSLGERANTIAAIGPIVATLLLSWRVGIAVMLVNMIITSQVFGSLTTMSAREGLPKAVLSGAAIVGLCFAAEKLRLYIEQRKTLEEELRQAKKMEAVGRLAGGVAHDINNTLNSIMASVFAHRQELADYGKQFPDLDNIAAACDRGAQLMRNLLGFARKSNYKRQSISVNDVIQSVHAILRRTANKNILIDLQLDPNRPAILGDQAQVESAVMNLCINALDAMPDGGTLTMRTGREGERVFLAVEDTGVGMDEAVRERVFEPFFTTKAAGKGTGLGLAMVYGVVHAAGGRIDLDTAPGKGTALTLFFPKATATPQPAVAERPRPAAARTSDLSGKTVLLIDDEPLVLRSGVRLLRALGCNVLSAPDGREGIALAKEREGAIDLVIVDFIMPEMDGVAVIEELHRLFPSLPAILASGYTNESARLEAVKEQHACVGFLAKPYRSDELVSIARSLLGLEPVVDAHAS
jgi:two-component system cell cycle sensor histidine kinase/response regulator CckA